MEIVQAYKSKNGGLYSTKEGARAADIKDILQSYIGGYPHVASAYDLANALSKDWDNIVRKVAVS